MQGSEGGSFVVNGQKYAVGANIHESEVINWDIQGGSSVIADTISSDKGIFLRVGSSEPLNDLFALQNFYKMP